MRKQTKRGFLTTLFFIWWGSASAYAQSTDWDQWTFSENGAEIVDYMGRSSLRLNRGFAQLENAGFRNGTIEFDISMEEKRGFAGVYFRWNDNSAEYFYLRPHMSGKSDANQYTPRFNGLAGWQLYHSPRFSVPTEYRFDSWIPVKLVVKDRKMDVYIDSDTPVLHVANLLGPDAAGSVNFGGAGQNFHFSNVRITNDDSVETMGEAADPVALPDNLIEEFSVASSTVADAAVEAVAELDRRLLEGQVWQTLEIDESGAANLAKVAGPDRNTNNTLLVKKTLRSDTEQTVRFFYGFSDRVTVFLNGRAIAHGDDTYQTRDYRHLGTVGLYDSVFLPLERGDNELIFAVTEGFGGWAIKAAMDPVDGVAVD